MSTPPESVTDAFRAAVQSRDARALRRLLERSDDARALIDEPLFSFGSTALLTIAGSGDLQQPHAPEASSPGRPAPTSAEPRGLAAIRQVLYLPARPSPGLTVLALSPPWSFSRP
jgi:hypothetical protein